MKVKGGKASHKKLKDLNSIEYTHLTKHQFDLLVKGKNADSLHSHYFPLVSGGGGGGASSHPNLNDMPDLAGTNADHDARYYTQEEIHELIAGASFSFHLSDTATGEGAPLDVYNLLYVADTGESQSTIATAITADATLIKEFITETAQPTFMVLSEGVYDLHVHLSATTSGKKTCRLYWEFYSRTTGGTETLLFTSEESDVLTNSDTSYEIHGTLSSEVVLNSDDRLVLKLYGNLESATGSNPTMTVYMEGTTHSRVSVRTTISAFDGRYLFQDGSKALAGNWDLGGYDLTNGGDITTKNLTVTEGNIRALRTETADHAVLATDYTILADASSNTVTITLPSSPTQGQIFNIFCIDSTYTCNVARNGKNINGAASDQPLLATESITVQYDSTYGWAII